MRLYKKVILTSLIITLPIILIACFDSGKYDGENFSFAYPDSWELASDRTSDDIEEVTLLPENDDEMAFTAEIDFLFKDLAEAEYSYSKEEFITKTAEEFDNFKKIEEYVENFEVLETKQIEVDDQPAFQIVFAQEDIMYNTIIIYKANRESVLNYIAKEDVYEDEVSMLDQILDSFEFKF